jgi:glycosyltransferase AglD
MDDSGNWENRAMVDLSIIIACYNCEPILESRIEELRNLFRHCQLTYEIVLVEDKSTDKTLAVAKQLAESNSDIKLIVHEENCGRGKTVADGFKAATGKIVGFNDIDFSTAPVYLLAMYLEMESGEHDIVTARRIYKISADILHRWILSRGYSFLVRWLLKLPFHDTETGCKLFRRDKIVPLLDLIEDNHWFWDTEIMYQAHANKLRVCEFFTLFLRERSIKSTVNVLRDTSTYFTKLVQFSLKHLHRKT